jgi:excisionase family DNA binding protein
MHPHQYEQAASSGCSRKQPEGQESGPAKRGPHPQPEGQVSGAGPPTVSPRDFGLVKVAYSVTETLTILSIGRTSIYRLVKQGALRPAKLGKKTLFYASDIAAFLSRLRETG